MKFNISFVIIKMRNQSQLFKNKLLSNTFNNLLGRNITNSPNKYCPITKKDEKKKKITITKRIIYPGSNKEPEVLEFQDSSVVMKRYNFENRYLYGPIQSIKKSTTSTSVERELRINNSSKIIQHQTNFPIIEPHIESKTNLVLNCENNQQLNFEKILHFPLLNEVNNKLISGKMINEFNLIRKYLENKCNSFMPSISKILEKTMPKESAEALARWKQSMIEKLGEEGFEKYRKELLENGSALHANINSYLASTPEDEIEINENNQGHWKSLKSIFPHISNVKLLEEKVSHPFLCYKGVVDCFAMYRDQLVVIDWKTSKKAKLTISSTFDNPLQIAAYVGALNFDPKFQYLVDKGLIVVAYEDGKPATAHFLDQTKLLQFWKEWLKRIQLYWSLTDTSENKL